MGTLSASSSLTPGTLIGSGAIHWNTRNLHWSSPLYANSLNQIGKFMAALIPESVWLVWRVWRPWASLSMRRSSSSRAISPQKAAGWNRRTHRSTIHKNWNYIRNINIVKMNVSASDRHIYACIVLQQCDLIISEKTNLEKTFISHLTVVFIFSCDSYRQETARIKETKLELKMNHFKL